MNAMKIKAPDPTDVYVGRRVRTRRLMLGVSQEKLGDDVGLTFQQIQKYEKGTNRISASRLQQFARILNVEVSYFFEGAPGATTSGSTSDYASEFLSTSDGLALAKAFHRIEDQALRRRIVNLVEAMAP